MNNTNNVNTLPEGGIVVRGQRFPRRDWVIVVPPEDELAELDKDMNAPMFQESFMQVILPPKDSGPTRAHGSVWYTISTTKRQSNLKTSIGIPIKARYSDNVTRVTVTYDPEKFPNGDLITFDVPTPATVVRLFKEKAAENLLNPTNPEERPCPGTSFTAMKKKGSSVPLECFYDTQAKIQAYIAWAACYGIFQPGKDPVEINGRLYCEKLCFEKKIEYCKAQSKDYYISCNARYSLGFCTFNLICKNPPKDLGTYCEAHRQHATAVYESYISNMSQNKLVVMDIMARNMSDRIIKYSETKLNDVLGLVIFDDEDMLEIMEKYDEWMALDLSEHIDRLDCGDHDKMVVDNNLPSKGQVLYAVVKIYLDGSIRGGRIREFDPTDENEQALLDLSFCPYSGKQLVVAMKGGPWQANFAFSPHSSPPRVTSSGACAATSSFNAPVGS
ncbi:hypothetical protein HDU76_003681, partial [Blyttiomyces sp. JEL0837]